MADIRNLSYAPRRIAALCVVLALAAATVTSAAAQTHVDPGFNLFSTEQEVELGREAARDVERQLPVLRDSRVTRYVEELGARLARQAPGAEYPYSFKVLDVADVNAFALPGGFIYVNRGLLESVRTEDELAGVLAHEIGHVALRHSTNQLSKNYLAKAGLSVLGGLIGDSTAGQILEAAGGTGVSLLFLKFSRTAEEQADTVGAQTMSRSGYDPLALATYFSRLASNSSGGPPEFLSSHPDYASRRENIEHEARQLTRADLEPVGDLSNVQARLEGKRPASSMSVLLDEEGPTGPDRGTDRGAYNEDVEIELPSSRFLEHRQSNDYYRIDYPENWAVHAGRDGFAVTIAPDDGIVATGSGRQEIVAGVVVNHYNPFLSDDDRPFSSFGFRSQDVFDHASSELREATQDLLVQILDGNPHLQAVAGSMQERSVDGRSALQAELTGLSPVTGERENVTLVTRGAGDGHVLYVLLISPGEHTTKLASTFDRMISSLRVNEGAVHHPAR